METNLCWLVLLSIVVPGATAGVCSNGQEHSAQDNRLTQRSGASLGGRQGLGETSGQRCCDGVSKREAPVLQAGEAWPPGTSIISGTRWERGGSFLLGSEVLSSLGKHTSLPWFFGKAVALLNVLLQPSISSFKLSELDDVDKLMGLLKSNLLYFSLRQIIL